MGRAACTEPQCMYSTAIPLLPLWAVRPVQNLSACTVHLYLYSPYGPYGLYRASVPVQGCTLPFYLHEDQCAVLIGTLLEDQYALLIGTFNEDQCAVLIGTLLEDHCVLLIGTLL